MDSLWIGSWLLLHVWQITLLFAVILVVTQGIGKRWPHLTLLLWCVFFIKCVTPPLIESPVGLLAWATPELGTESGVDWGLDGNLFGFDRSIHPNLTASEVTTNTITQTDGARFPTWADGLMATWLFGVIAWGGFSIVRYRRIVRIVSAELEEANQHQWLAPFHATFAKQLQHLGWDSGAVKCVVSCHFDQPFVFGFFHPVVVIPHAFLGRPEIVSSVMAHEICHLWRRDPLLGWLQLLAQSLLWFHPVVWWASRKTNFWCEVCCDDDAVRMFAIPSTKYARGLVLAMEQQSTAWAMPAAPGLSAYLLTRQRLAMILNRRHSGLFRATHQLSACLLLLLLVPTLPSADGRLGIRSFAAPDSSTSDSLPTTLADGLTRMEFLIGDWDVYLVDDNDKNTRTGTSSFVVEPSGKMIREDWVARNGDTAQGYTFIEPASQQWRMTWVDSGGNVSESEGNWKGDELVLQGNIATGKGVARPSMTKLKPISNEAFRSTTLIKVEGKYRPVGVVIYRRR